MHPHGRTCRRAGEIKKNAPPETTYRPCSRAGVAAPSVPARQGTTGDASQAVQLHPNGGQVDFARLSTRTHVRPMRCIIRVGELAKSRKYQEKYPPEAFYRSLVGEQVKGSGVRIGKTDVGWIGAGYKYAFESVRFLSDGIETNSDGRRFIWTVEGWVRGQTNSTTHAECMCVCVCAGGS